LHSVLSNHPLFIGPKHCTKDFRLRLPNFHGFNATAPSRLQIIKDPHNLEKDPESIAPKERLEIIAKMISGLIDGLDKRDG
jgi:hypothetical protein